VRGRNEDNVDVAASIQNLAATLIRQDRFSEAESLSLEAFRIYVDLLPEGHYLPAFPLLTVAESQLLRGDGARAERTARRAVEILRAGLPAGHFATAAAECRLGAAIAQQARYSDAEPLMASSLERLRSNEQAPDRYVRECADALAALRRATVRSGDR
jgi:hypothetical protein